MKILTLAMTRNLKGKWLVVKIFPLIHGRGIHRKISATNVYRRQTKALVLLLATYFFLKKSRFYLDCGQVL